MRFVTALFLLVTMLLSSPVLAEDALGVEVPVNKDAVTIEGRPLTGVVVTMCNQLVVVYVTMPDGKLVRLDKSSGLAANKLVQLAYTAARSERIEISCDGSEGQFETHSGGPTT